MMTKYEYKYVILPADPAMTNRGTKKIEDEVTGMLNDLGAEGWELLTAKTFGLNNALALIFKRTLQ